MRIARGSRDGRLARLGSPGDCRRPRQMVSLPGVSLDAGKPNMSDTMKIAGLSLPKEAPGAKGQSVVRFGEKAIELRLLTVEQVEQALNAQGDARRQGLD